MGPCSGRGGGASQPLPSPGALGLWRPGPGPDRPGRVRLCPPGGGGAGTGSGAGPGWVGPGAGPGRVTAAGGQAVATAAVPGSGQLQDLHPPPTMPLPAVALLLLGAPLGKGQGARSGVPGAGREQEGQDGVWVPEPPGAAPVAGAGGLGTPQEGVSRGHWGGPQGSGGHSGEWGRWGRAPGGLREPGDQPGSPPRPALSAGRHRLPGVPG